MTSQGVPFPALAAADPLRAGAAGVPASGDADPGTAKAVARGIARLFARNDIWCLPEMPLRSGRRADLMGVDAKGHVIIVEIKVSRADLLGDGKWPDYLDHCDRFFWGLHPSLDRACLETPAFRPDACGVIVADGYDAEILRPAPTLPLAAARRRAEVERLARAALRRQVVAADPHCATFGAGL
ncbi:MmcB family DNA repair protein [Novosphingobium flavum]|uniref:MmcB family DNA repair protein n=1 Tax=Novosphingobium aerophilum TaxID=2839843 RepID=A0A7X1KD56_9SPHN|nr:MmcB family DNA repair protein [Novosphingobium aerophilum]MBC2653000.1 MmcB family DNA repair protein [Novosphingobium aerophilum]MBC2663096.1 MmcB family DNA repair protein [Novosphingobium aerophilum]